MLSGSLGGGGSLLKSPFKKSFSFAFSSLGKTSSGSSCSEGKGGKTSESGAAKEAVQGTNIKKEKMKK
jgi:hypothetical protein